MLFSQNHSLYKYIPCRFKKIDRNFFAYSIIPLPVTQRKSNGDFFIDSKIKIDYTVQPKLSF